MVEPHVLCVVLLERGALHEPLSVLPTDCIMMRGPARKLRDMFMDSVVASRQTVQRSSIQGGFSLLAKPYGKYFYPRCLALPSSGYAVGCWTTKASCVLTR